MFDCRAEPVLDILRSESVALCTLKVTASGYPWQPLAVSSTTRSTLLSIDVQAIAGRVSAGVPAAGCIAVHMMQAWGLAGAAIS